MKADSLTLWMVEKRRTSILLSSLGAVGLLLAATVALAITYWVLFMLLAAVGPTDFLSDRWRRNWWPAIGLGILFVLQLVISRRALENYSFEGGSRQVFARAASRATGYSVLALAAGPQTALSFVKLVLSLLLIGPALVVTATKLAARAFRLLRFDVDRCGVLITTLLAADAKVPYDHLRKQHARLKPDELLPQLADIDGIMFRTSDPPGLSLSAELREEIAAWRRKHRAAKTKAETQI